MSVFMHAVRLLVGISLVAGGVVLAQPFVATVLAARQRVAAPVAGPVPMDMRRSFPPPGLQPTMPDGVDPAGSWPQGPERMQTSPGPAVVSGPGAFPQPTGGFAGMGAAVMPPSRPPPAAIAPLPRSAADATPAAPILDGAYRSTLDIPPPPLLDTQSPPPLAVGWSAHDAARPVAVAASEPTSQSNYVVRDGDDLTGIALRFYGSAGAASAIWAANRDRLPDPQLLPIGLVLRMPPSWTLPSVHAGQGTGAGQAIEPTFGPASPTSASWRTTRPAAADQRGTAGGTSWLQQADGEAGRHEAGRYPAEPPTDAHGMPPSSARVAAGDTLESIAVRFYGDRTAAARIWQANRDRLRSPDLLVPGTDLRLP